MDIDFDATALPLYLSSDLSALQLLVLGLALLVLGGSMIMPALVYAARKLPLLASAAVRRLSHYIVDKIIESIIIALATLFGTLSLLKALMPAIFP